MQIQIAISIEKNHISFAVDGKTRVCRCLTQMEMLAIKEAANYECLEICEDDKGQAALLSYFTLELCGKIKYGMDEELKAFIKQEVL